ncbi:MAG: hypothetical protein KF893_04985 [Caldilineaceae bacterium]|nr:hypothetical protein [Caldilineaceae bacterium]
MIGPSGEQLSLAEFIAGAGLDNRINIISQNAMRRIDAEFYLPKFEKIEALVNAYPRTAKLENLTRRFNKGIFDIKADEYVSEGIPFVRISNLKDCLIKEDSLAFITPARHRQEFKTALKRYDLAISKTAIPAASIVQLDACNTSQDIIAVETNQSSDFNIYLAIYLNSQFGLTQMERHFQGNIQQHLSLADAKSIRIPVPPTEFLTQMRSLFDSMLEKKESSARLYEQAEDLLLTGLGLDTLDLSPQLTYTGTFGEMANAARFDGEYFQPKYQRAMDLLKSTGQTIGSVARLSKRRFVPKHGRAFHYIEISDVTSKGRVEASEIFGEDAPSRAQFVVHSGDVITSTVRPIRRLSALIEPPQHGYVCSSGFAVLQSQEIEPELLLVYLRLPIIAEILDLHTTASMYPAISTADLLDIPIVVPNSVITSQIVQKVKQSRMAGLEAKQLLETAKQTIEQMILGETE